MKFLSYEYESREMAGVLSTDGRRVYSLLELGFEAQGLCDFIEKYGAGAVSAAAGALSKLEERGSGACGTDFSQVKLLAPIVYPGQDVICLGINYADHAEESARFKLGTYDRDEAAPAVYFSKRVNRAVAHGEPVQGHTDVVAQLDYEVELAVVMGKDAYNVSREEAYNYIFGYTILNDVTSRDIQMRHNQWYFGKSLDGFTPMGPYIVTEDEFGRPPVLEIRSRVNGELRQSSSTAFLIHGIAEVICELSQGMTLKAGTIISMGTPAGVGMGFDPPKFLSPGDVVTCEIEGIGVLENRVEE